MEPVIFIVLILVAVLVLMPLIVNSFLRSVGAGSIRMVSWLNGGTKIYRGPGKSVEIPLLTTGTTLSSKAINVDLDITDQTADLDATGTPQPIKVRVLASAIVSVGDSDTMIKTAANRFFSKPQEEQLNILIDLLSSSGRRAINLLTHDQLFSAKTAPRLAASGGAAAAAAVAVVEHEQRAVVVGRPVDAEDDDDPLAIIIRKACSRELTDLGLAFNSLNIKVVQSEVAEARRRMSAAEAQANADIVAAQQSRRSKEAELEAEREISNKQREVEQTRASNAALIAQAEVLRQQALAQQRIAELEATQTAQARADAERVKIQALAGAEAEALRIKTVADATAESIRKVNDAIRHGGESYFRYRQIEMLPELAPSIAEALARSRMVTISGGGAEGGAPESTASSITGVIQTILAAQMVGTGMFTADGDGASPPATPAAPALPESNGSGRVERLASGR